MTSIPNGEVIHRREVPHAIRQMDFVELRVGPERVVLLLARAAATDLEWREA